MKITKRTKELNQEYFFDLFEQFIMDSKKGFRIKPDGRLIRASTIKNYSITYKALKDFTEKTGFTIRLYIASNLTKNETIEAQRYNQQLYYQFSEFLYKKGFYDNFVGHIIKVLKVFYNYLINEKHLNLGSFHKKFYVFKEEIPIVVLSPEQLNYLAFNQNFHCSLDEKMRIIKDIFVFGCTVALRVGDLLNLKQFNLIKSGNEYYLKVYSQKTSMPSLIKLPPYALEILKKYECRQSTLLPFVSMAHFNKMLKILARHITNDEPMIKTRARRGEHVVIYKDESKKIHYKMADHITTHTMRRTAITTMLRLGMEEAAVRRISGHSPHSKEFYKYVAFSQAYMDRETDKIFEKLQKIV